MRVADKSYYTNADKSKLVKEGSDEAAFLVVGKGGEVTDEMAEKYGIKGAEQEEAQAEPGVVISSAGEDGGAGFVKAADVQAVGGVVTDAPPAEANAEDAAPKTTKKSASKSAKK